MANVHFTVDDGEVMAQLSQLAAGPDTAGFEAAMLQGFMATSEHVHVITGGLKASGHTSSEYQADVWTGTIAFARHPGIFELARKNTPTANHPEGGHDFFNEPDSGGHQFVDLVKQHIEDWLEEVSHG